MRDLDREKGAETQSPKRKTLRPFSLFVAWKRSVEEGDGLRREEKRRGSVQLGLIVLCKIKQWPAKRNGTQILRQASPQSIVYFHFLATLGYLLSISALH